MTLIHHRTILLEIINGLLKGDFHNYHYEGITLARSESTKSNWIFTTGKDCRMINMDHNTPMGVANLLAKKIME